MEIQQILHMWWVVFFMVQSEKCSYIEKIQRRATEMIEGFWKLSYDKSLQIKGLTTL